MTTLVLVVWLWLGASPGLAQGITSTDIQAFTLENGLTVLIVERPGVPIVAVDVWVNTGTINETKIDNGISHFFEHMLFKGTERRPPGAIDREIEGVGGRTNAATSFDWTHYFAVVPSEHVGRAIDILADVTGHSVFPEEEVARELDVVRNEIAQRSDNPTQFTFFQLFQSFYRVHPYHLPLAGTEASLNQLNREDLLSYMDRYYAPNNMTLVVVGEIDAEAVLAAVNAAFSDFESRQLSQPVYPQEPMRDEKQVTVIERDVQQGYLAIGWPAPSVRQANDVYAMDVLLAVLSQGRGSRFYKNIYRELEIVTSVDASYLTQKEPGIFSVFAVFPYENREIVEVAIFEELRRVLSGDLTATELERAKTILLSDYAFSSETNAGLAFTLGFYAVVAGDYRFAVRYPEGIREVSLEDLVRTANRYIDLDRYVEVVLKPKGGEGQ
ncbi:MAG: M16 family metallopeptidase [Candidatus Bipolaricaulia bacterium]